MKKVLLKRVFAVTLAGTLALSLPLTAMAAGGEGGTEGDASVIGGDGDFFSVVLPTNTASNVDFKIDPAGVLAGGMVEGIDKDEYEENTALYFSRIDYSSLKMGNKGTTAEPGKGLASYYWGSVINETKDDGSTVSPNRKYGNESNWMTITNKSAKPVTVELKVNWSNTDQVAIVSSRDAAKKSEDAAIYMEVQASEGRTNDFYGYAGKVSAWQTTENSASDAGTITKDSDGKVTSDTRTNGQKSADAAVLNYEYQKLDKDKKLVTTADATVGQSNLNWTYEPVEENSKLLKLQEMPVVTQEDLESTVTWVIPTVNNTYHALHEENANYRAIDKIIAGAPALVQAYYLRAYYKDPVNELDHRHEVSGFEVWKNREPMYRSSEENVYIKGTDQKEGVVPNTYTKAPFSTTDQFNGYDESISIYPTYGFRLAGEASKAGWQDVTEMPKITLSWKVTIGEPNEEVAITKKSPVVWDGISNVQTDKELDTLGVTDDTQFFRVKADGTTLTEVKIKATASGYEETLWKDGKPVYIDAEADIAGGMMPMGIVKGHDEYVYDPAKDAEDYRFYIGEITLMNYSQTTWMNNGTPLELTFIFTDKDSEEPIPVKVVLKDSRNAAK